MRTKTNTKAAKSKARKAVKGKTSAKRKNGGRSHYPWNDAEQKAAKGQIPSPPDFSAPTHERFRPLLAEVVKAAKAGDLDALKRVKVNPISSSPKAVDRYRKLCVEALKAKSA